jgi:hypothetical protein
MAFVALGQAHDHLVRMAVRADIRHGASQPRASALDSVWFTSADCHDFH